MRHANKERRVERAEGEISFVSFPWLSNDKVEKLRHHNPSRSVIIEESPEKGEPLCGDYVFTVYRLKVLQVL